MLPGLNGRELAERLLVDRPNMHVLYMSGYTDHAVLRDSILKSGANFLQKPFSPLSLASKVRDVLERRQPGGR